MDANPAIEGPPTGKTAAEPTAPEPQPPGYRTEGTEASVNGLARGFYEAAGVGPERLRLGLRELPPSVDERRAVALLCYEGPESLVGAHVARLAAAFARRGCAVHLLTRQPFPEQEGVTVHAVGGDGPDVLAGVDDYTPRACAAYRRQFPPGGRRPLLVAHEWSTAAAAAALKRDAGDEALLSLHSLERQRSSVDNELSRRIDERELAAVREARAVLLHNAEAGEVLKYWAPGCLARIARAREQFPVHKFTGVTDAGAIKARYQVGPTDPMIVFLGDFDERHGPDVLMKSAPAILKNHPQTHFVFVGDGALQWPLRVYARYLLLEHRVRLPGSVEGQAAYELIQAADVVVAPSRVHTEWWPFQAAWAARRPVVATHAFKGAPLEHERDCVLVYPHESSVVWGVERLLYDPGLRERLTQRGFEKLGERFGWNGLAEQIEELMGVRKPA
jgi:glycosyltransferase involved in cell wall biosynthesis